MRALLLVALAMGASADCSSYCNSVLANCMGANAVYVDSPACLAECAFFAATTVDEMAVDPTNTGNTLGCREYHAGAAAGDAAIHCPHARPDSTFCKSAQAAANNLTSGTCDNYCDNLVMTCGAENSNLGASRTACMNSCSYFADQATLMVSYPVSASTTGDLGCRRYHVQAARGSPAAATTHCPHADLTGGGVCGNGCTNFCQSAMFCPTSSTGYADPTSCQNICNTFTPGSPADKGGDTFNCRAYHLTVALQGGTLATTHCPHLGQSGQGACGTPCDAYCSQYKFVCTGITGAAAYADTTACMNACSAFNSAAPLGATGGDSLQCRLYHLGVAAQSAALAQTHCAHAAQNGGGVCVPPPATCTDYCNATITNCQGADAVFAGADDMTRTMNCMAECAAFDAQSSGATRNEAANTGNNLGCRTYHAIAAATGASVHCPHARPDSTLCKSTEATAATLSSGTCDNYCDNLKITCPNSLLSQQTRVACITACSRWRDQASPTGMYPVPATATGDLACRRYHLQVARTDAATHCPHADLLGGYVCGDAGFNFCQQATATCTNAQTGYADMASCQMIWKNMPTGTLADTSGDTQGCRNYHLSVALASANNAETHCPHTGQSGMAACGSSCDAYCSQYAANCTGVANAAAYATTQACTTACGAFSSTAAMGATSGDSLQCRLYHLGVAQQSAPNSMTHCPHASQSGGGVCVNPTSAPTPAPNSAAPTPAPTSQAPTTAAPPTTAQQFCDKYCADVATAGCGYFATTQACQLECSFFPKSGNMADTTGNSLECRAYHAAVAAGSTVPADKTAHCGHAAPASTGFCVGDTDNGKCDDYCNQLLMTCPTAHLEGGWDDTPANRASCLAACAAFDLTTTANSYATYPLPSSTGDTLLCRRYHVQVARTAQVAHCPHAAPWGGDNCGSLCEAFCRLSTSICADTAMGGYASTSACQTACQGWSTTPAFGATSGHSYQCRLYHLLVAASDGATSRATHCPHQAADGGSVCVAPMAPTPISPAARNGASLTAFIVALAFAIRAAF